MDFTTDFDANPRPFKNPAVTFFHLFFRFSALFLYLFGSFFSSSYIGIFVPVSLLLSLDFWTVKNITGRIMVGLRWWNYINEEGQSQWVFEARNGNSKQFLSKNEIRIFWTALIVAPALWVIFFLTAFFRFNFQWLVLVVIGLTLSTSNLLGYLKCSMGHTDSAQSSMTSMANTYMRNQMFSNVANLFSGGSSGAGDSTNMASNMQNVI